MERSKDCGLYVVKFKADFEKGDCGRCPLSYLGDDCYGETDTFCVLGGSAECPLVLEEE